MCISVLCACSLLFCNYCLFVCEMRLSYKTPFSTRFSYDSCLNNEYNVQ